MAGLAAVVLLTVLASVSALNLTFPLTFNFHAGSRGCSETGIIEDGGSPYGTRCHGGLTYGWRRAHAPYEPLDTQISFTGRRTADVSCLNRAFAEMQPGDEVGNPQIGPRLWQVDGLENGMYTVEVELGNSGFPGDGSSQVIRANGRRVVGPVSMPSMGKALTARLTVSVEAGRLILSAKAGKKTRLARVTLFRGVSSPSGTQLDMGTASAGKLVNSTASPGSQPVARQEATKPMKPGKPDAGPAVTVSEGGCAPFPSQFNGAAISSLPCEDLQVLPRYLLSFGRKQLGVADKDGLLTGLRMYLPASNNAGYYNKDLLSVFGGFGLRMTASAGTMIGKYNNHVNALGVAVDVPAQALSFTMKYQIPVGSDGEYGRACLFFGNSERNFAMICIVNADKKRGKFKVEFLLEVDDKEAYKQTADVQYSGAGPYEFVMQMQALPLTKEVRVRYRTVGPLVNLARTKVPGEFFSFDAASTDFRVKSNSFAGPHVTKPVGKPVNFFLRSFEVDAIAMDDDAETTPGVDFTTSYLKNLPYPTAMSFGPDGKLYVVNAQCQITIISFTPGTVRESSRRRVQPLGVRLCLGIEIDPESAADNVVLWLSHSDGSQDNGAPNSGKVTRLSGSNFSKVKDVVVGLPRAIANHGPNQLHFGKDGRLYIAIGSNTAGGSPISSGGAFGPRPEQCLSAALLVADVKRKGFNGYCFPLQAASEMDSTGFTSEECATLCDVKVFSSGLRSTYDFTWRKGVMYATENGLGTTGAAPQLPAGYSPGSSCNGPVPDEAKEAQYPGAREDVLVKPKPGAYFGFPNPARRECIFYGGNPTKRPDSIIPRLPLQKKTFYSQQTNIYAPGRAPDPRFRKAELSFGLSRSPNGIITYKGEAFCGKMKNDLLVTWYSQLDQVRWLKFDKNKVVSDETLSRTSLQSGGEALMRNPLCLTQSPSGDIFVGEFLGERVRVLRPLGDGSCTRRTSSESPHNGEADAVGVNIGHTVFTLGSGRDLNGGSEVTNVHLFDAHKDEWKHLDKIPLALRSMAATNWRNQRVLAFGGFHRGLPTDGVYEVDAQGVRQIASMPSSRGGASAVSLSNGSVLIIGGATEQGDAATDSVLRFSPETSSWTGAPSLTRARAHAAAASTGDCVLVCGGVGRDGTIERTCEYFDGNKWVPHNDLPRPLSRAGMVVMDDGSFIVKGGESEDGQISDVIYEWTLLSEKWEKIGEMRTPRSRGIHVRLPGMGIYSFGGVVRGSYTPHGEIFEYK